MQTFLPYDNFYHSAQCLDDKRLGKQRVECIQILHSLLRHQRLASSAWQHHPAVLMWKGYELALCDYGLIICNEWFFERQNRDTVAAQIEVIQGMLLREKRNSTMPPWLGNPKLHASHRSNLLRKYPEWYGKFGWTEPADLPYFWPVQSKD